MAAATVQERSGGPARAGRRHRAGRCPGRSIVSATLIPHDPPGCWPARPSRPMDGRFACSWIPEDPPPIWLAALGPRAMRLAGEVADGVMLNWCPPERVAVARSWCGRAAGRTRSGGQTVAVYVRASVGQATTRRSRRSGRPRGSTPRSRVSAGSSSSAGLGQHNRPPPRTPRAARRRPRPAGPRGRVVGDPSSSRAARGVPGGGCRSAGRLSGRARDPQSSVAGAERPSPCDSRRPITTSPLGHWTRTMSEFHGRHRKEGNDLHDRGAMHRREGPRLRRRMPGGLHLRGSPDALYPPRRVRRLWCLRAGLPGHRDLLRGRCPRRMEAVHADQRGVLRRNVSGVGSPGGAAQVGPQTVDHPTVASWAAL